MNLGNNERKMLRLMLSKPSIKWKLEDLLKGTGWTDQVHVAGSGGYLNELGLVEIIENKNSKVSLGPEGLRSLEQGLLESRLWNWLLSNDSENRTMNNLLDSDFERHETGPGVGILKGLGVSINKGVFTTEDESNVNKIIESRTSFLATVSKDGCDLSSLDDELVKHFSSRKGLIQIEENTTRHWILTDSGKSIQVSDIEEVELIGEITPELLQSDRWKGAKFKPFDVNAPAPTPTGGRPHPMQSLIERIRSVFLEMGFQKLKVIMSNLPDGIWMPYIFLNHILQEQCKILSIYQTQIK